MKNYVLSAIVAFALSLLFCRILIPILKRIKAGQNILVYVKEHEGKSGTPTMGGIAFVLAAVLTTCLFVKTADRTTIITLAVGVSYMIVGILDDFLKRKHKENLGLRAWQKLAFQTIIAVFCGIYCYRADITKLGIPFTNSSFSIGWGIIPVTVFVFLAIVNAVNLTDGLDGLAAGCCAPFFATLGIIVLLQNQTHGISYVCFCLTGSLLAYLLFNVSPASVFMGDTGSLALGGFVACTATFTGNALYIPILGICFVLSVISVILQVIYYKATGGKRIFLMSPVHHHFQQKGLSETRISYAYSVVTLVIGGLCIAALG